MNEARSHAITASELLASIDRFQDDLDQLEPEDRLQSAASGAMTRDNANLRWTSELATAHALAALALALTRDQDGAAWLL